MKPERAEINDFIRDFKPEPEIDTTLFISSERQRDMVFLATVPYADGEAVARAIREAIRETAQVIKRRLADRSTRPVEPAATHSAEGALVRAVADAIDAAAGTHSKDTSCWDDHARAAISVILADRPAKLAPEALTFKDFAWKDIVYAAPSPSASTGVGSLAGGEGTVGAIDYAKEAEFAWSLHAVEANRWETLSEEDKHGLMAVVAFGIGRGRSLSRTPPKAETETETGPVVWWNGCDVTVPQALRYLAENDRPQGGEQHFNSAHLHQLAGEIERMARTPLYARPAPAETASEREKLVEALRRAQAHINDAYDVARQWHDLAAAHFHANASHDISDVLKHKEVTVRAVIVHNGTLAQEEDR